MTLDAEIDDIWCTYPNGKTIRCSKPFRNPKVLDGSIITVGKKKEEEPFDKTEYFKELTSIIANFSQAFSLIYLAITN